MLSIKKSPGNSNSTYYPYFHGILLGTKQSANEELFSLLHELGHASRWRILLAINKNTTSSRIILREEQEAWRYAARCIQPGKFKKELLAEAKKSLTLYAQHYGYKKPLTKNIVDVLWGTQPLPIVK